MRIVYFDETGDDGLVKTSSQTFVLTSFYMPSQSWQSNFNKVKEFRKSIKEKYGLHTSQQLHTKQFLTDKGQYRQYNWTPQQRKNILIEYTHCIASLQAKSINVIIDKNNITNAQEYNILKNALTYNIQRIDNDSGGQWNYLVITDQGRIAPMKKAARQIRSYNPIPSHYTSEIVNRPVKNMIQDIMQKDSSQSYFIQICDFISYFVHLYYKTNFLNQQLPNRATKVIDKTFPGRILATLQSGGILNLKASNNRYGLVIYPRA